jgi:hypothetical protein
LRWPLILTGAALAFALAGKSELVFQILDELENKLKQHELLRIGVALAKENDLVGVERIMDLLEVENQLKVKVEFLRATMLKDNNDEFLLQELLEDSPRSRIMAIQVYCKSNASRGRSPAAMKLLETINDPFNKALGSLAILDGLGEFTENPHKSSNVEVPIDVGTVVRNVGKELVWLGRIIQINEQDYRVVIDEVFDDHGNDVATRSLESAKNANFEKRRSYEISKNKVERVTN